MFAGSGRRRRRRRTLRLAGRPAAPTDCCSIYNNNIIVYEACILRGFFHLIYGSGPNFFSDFLRKHRVRSSIIRYRTINSPGPPRPFASEAMLLARSVLWVLAATTVCCRAAIVLLLNIYYLIFIFIIIIVVIVVVAQGAVRDFVV